MPDLSRKDVLRAGLLAGGGAAAGAALLAGLPQKAASKPSKKQDAEILNAVLVLEALQVAFYADALERARSSHEGLTVRYEELTADPAAEMKRICAFLDVEWEAGMLDYGRYDHGAFRPGLGDWSDKIRSGEIQPAAPTPSLEETDPALRALATAWGYTAGVAA